MDNMSTVPQSPDECTLPSISQVIFILFFVLTHCQEGILTDSSTGENTLYKWLTEITEKYSHSKEDPLRVAPVGRLDRETTGLLLLTNDSDLNHAIRKVGKDNNTIE